MADQLSSSLFESLREVIYSEVASLISHNEKRPHYLVELFRRLQLLSTDDQRRRLLATFEQLVADYLTDSDNERLVTNNTAMHPAVGLHHCVCVTVLRIVTIVLCQCCLTPRRLHGFWSDNVVE